MSMYLKSHSHSCAYWSNTDAVFHAEGDSMNNPAAMSGLCIALAVRFAATNVIKILDTDPVTTDPVLFDQKLSELLITDGDPIRTFIKMLKSLVPDGAA